MHIEVLTVIGTRPEVIQFSPLLSELDKHFNHKYVYTNQHYSDSMVQFDKLDMRKPDFVLTQYTSNPETIMLAIFKMVSDWHITFDNMIIIGNSNSALGAAIAFDRLRSQGMKAKLIHINGGMRCHDPLMPEEKNTKYIDKISDFILCHTKHEKLNIFAEGMTKKVFKVGDLLFDALKRISNEEVPIDFEKPYVVLTLHRAGNVDNKYVLKSLFNEFNKIPYHVVMPIHPRTRERIQQFNINIAPQIEIIDPLSYIEFINLMKNAFAIITDSINVPLEASALGIPCLSVRNVTERPNTVVYGTNILVGRNISLLNFYLDMLSREDYRIKLGIMKQDYSTIDRIINIMLGLKYLNILEEVLDEELYKRWDNYLHVSKPILNE